MSDSYRLTMRQVEVVRAIFISGSISAAARLLNVSSPGLSRTMKHLDSKLSINLFIRQSGHLVPAPEAAVFFEQIMSVNDKMENLQYAFEQIGMGKDVELSIGSVPSIGWAMAPRAIGKLKDKYPLVQLHFDLLKIEEAVDYLMLRKAELVCMSYAIEHPVIEHRKLASGKLVCIVSRDHPLAKKQSVSARDIAAYSIIGIDPHDPYGRMLTQIFRDSNVDYHLSVRVRFGASIISLVQQNIGVAVIDIFSLGAVAMERDNIVCLPIQEETAFDTFVSFRKGSEFSAISSDFIDFLSDEMERESNKW